MLLSSEPPSRQLVSDLLFPEADDPHGALRWNLAQLRQALGGDAEVGADPLRLELPPDTAIDVMVLRSSAWPDALGLPGLGRELLEGVDRVTSPSFDAWLLAERRRIAGLSAAILREAATARLVAGEAASAVDLATRLVAIDEFDEEAQALLIRAHLLTGQRDQARGYLAATIEMFRRQLGVEPSITLLRAADGRPSGGMVRGATSRAGITSLIEAGEAAVGAGALEAGLDTLHRAASDARLAVDDRLAGRALIALGTAYVHGGRGRDGEGAMALHSGLGSAEAAGDEGLVSEACRELGYIEFLRGRYDRAEIWLERSIRVAPDAGLRSAAQSIRGALLTDRGETEAAIELLTEAAEQAVAFGKVRLVAWANAFLGRVHILREEPDAAKSALTIALDGVHAASWLTFRPFVDCLLGSLALDRGDLSGAAELFDSAFAVGCQIGDPCWEGMAARGIGLVHLARGETAEAISWLDDSSVRCLRVSDAYMWIHAYCLDALCAAALENGHPDGQRWVGDLETVAARTGMSELLVRAYLHRAAAGDPIGVLSAQLFAGRVDNPVLQPALAGSPAAAAATH